MERATDGTGEIAARLGSGPLEALRWNWGEAYEIKIRESEWQARRLDGLGGWMTAPNAGELRERILSDYVQKPVPRTPTEN